MLFTRDCDKCVFLAIFEKADLYFCPAEPTVVARFSNEGSDYKSGLMFAEGDRHLGEALRLARQHTLIG